MKITDDTTMEELAEAINTIEAERDNAQTEIESLKEELKALKAEHETTKAELHETKKINFTLARMKDTEKTPETILHDLFM